VGGAHGWNHRLVGLTCSGRVLVRLAVCGVGGDAGGGGWAWRVVGLPGLGRCFCRLSVGVMWVGCGLSLVPVVSRPAAPDAVTVCGGGGWCSVGVSCWGWGVCIENCTVDASIFVAKFLRAHGGCLGTRNR
jgi:hypothetical protein